MAASRSRGAHGAAARDRRRTVAVGSWVTAVMGGLLGEGDEAVLERGQVDLEVESGGRPRATRRAPTWASTGPGALDPDLGAAAVDVGHAGQAPQVGDVELGVGERDRGPRAEGGDDRGRRALGHDPAPVA